MAMTDESERSTNFLPAVTRVRTPLTDKWSHSHQPVSKSRHRVRAMPYEADTDGVP